MTVVLGILAGVLVVTFRVLRRRRGELRLKITAAQLAEAERTAASERLQHAQELGGGPKAKGEVT
jgi:type II secretory pathway pseudopilin PulG